MERISIVYVDDKPDPFLEKYLMEYCNNDTRYDLQYSEITFEPQSGYKELLQKERIKSANIVFIDSLLFENDSVGDNKFTGEEISVVLRKQFPYIEIFLITQNDIEGEFEYIRKFRSSRGSEDYISYYDKSLPEKIDKAINNIVSYRNCVKKLNDNPAWECVLKEKINNTITGNDNYNEMTKDDIDEVVRILKEIQNKYGV